MERSLLSGTENRDLNYRVQETQQSRKITLDVDHIKAFEHETPPSWMNGLKCDVEVQTQTNM